MRVDASPSASPHTSTIEDATFSNQCSFRCSQTVTDRYIYLLSIENPLGVAELSLRSGADPHTGPTD